MTDAFEKLFVCRKNIDPFQKRGEDIEKCIERKLSPFDGEMPQMSDAEYAKTERI